MKKILCCIGAFEVLSFALIGFKYVTERVINNVRC